MCSKEKWLPILTSASINTAAYTAATCIYIFGAHADQTTTPAQRIATPCVASLLGMITGALFGIIISNIKLDDEDSCTSGRYSCGAVDIVTTISSFVANTGLVIFYSAMNLLSYDPEPFLLTNPNQQACFAAAFVLISLGGPASAITATAVRKRVKQEAHNQYNANMLRTREERHARRRRRVRHARPDSKQPETRLQQLRSTSASV